MQTVQAINSNTPSSLPALSAGGGRLTVATVAPCASHRDASGTRAVQDEGVSLSPAFTIGCEAGADVAARDRLLDHAMGSRWRKKSSEKLRRGRLPAEGLAFVARDDAGTVLGTVRLWEVTAGEGGPVVLLLGPLAVDPAMKSAGIGSALMRHAIAEAARLGHGAILLVGDAPYYARFGFSAEKTAGLAMPGPFEPHRFLALELREGTLNGAAGVLCASGRKTKTARIARAA
ncbi:MAG: N-acetyltransferase [Rhizobiaceae bacterium]|nr:N-acetyltransferase [Rhizobiaceae bacterium]